MNFYLKKRIYFPQSQNQKLKLLIISASIVSLAAYLSVQKFSPEHSLSYSDNMIKSVQIMERALSSIRDYCDNADIPINEPIDPNRTGLIGTEISGIATTLGNLEAKRTTTNPNFAAIIVQLLNEAGITSGDTIAIGCSASFPALMIASLAASQAMEVHPIVMISLGASSFGATNPNFNLLDIYKVLLEKNVFTVSPAAISLGGDQDIGRDFDPSIRNLLIQQIQASGIPFIFESDLQKNVALRMKIYEGRSSRSRISALINIGGSYANIGTSELVLKVKPGLNKNISIPPKAERGVLFEMADRNIPIIHLLYIKGLAMKYGLPWDPIPLPKAEEFEPFNMRSNHKIRSWLISIIYFLILIVLFIYGFISKFSPMDR
jgi:poly-gamma-glutamate system protein